MPMFNYNNTDNIQICMDVPFVDHPYLIGPRGRKCQHLMDRYRSLIHFPDSNRRQNGPKLNNVIIHGSSKNAEELRFQIRSRTPIRLAILLQNVPDTEALCTRMESAIVERSLPIRLNYTENFSNAMLKTEWRNEDVLVKFCEEFVGAPSAATAGLDSSPAGDGGADLYTMALTVLPVLNPWNAELSRQLIDHIRAATDARVYYPSKEMFADQPPSYFIKADSVESVLQAGKYLMGLTMFQVSFVVPSNVQLNLQNASDWQRDLLVHTSVEPVFSNANSNNGNGNGKSEFLHNRAVLRSFEFCLNSIYFVRSLLLGFKKTVQSSQYNFMTDLKRMIPHTIFSGGQLYFPLYAIDDDRAFDFDTAGAEFFRKFYGGPYSLKEEHGKELREHPASPTQLDVVSGNSINADLTSRLKSLLNISGMSSGSDAADLSTLTSLTNITTAADVSEEVLLLDDTQSGQNLDIDSAVTKNASVADVSEETIEFARHSSPNVLGTPASFVIPRRDAMAENEDEPSVEPLMSDSPPNAISFVPFNQSTPLRGGVGEIMPHPIIFSNCCIAATSPDTVDHEDDPELQALLRRTMPCLQVTQQQVKAMDLDRIARALMTADGLAVFTNAPAMPFVPSAYAVSYPTSVDAIEFERQFREFVRRRNIYLQLHRSKIAQPRKEDVTAAKDSPLAVSGGSGKSGRTRRSSF